MDAFEQIKTALQHYDQMTADADDAVSELAESVRAALKAAAEQEPHTDDLAVDRFASAMKAKLAKKRDEGRGGWDNPKECEMEDLAKMLIDHVPKGDTIDIANFCMMLYEREQMAIEHHPCYGGFAKKFIQHAVREAESELVDSVKEMHAPKLTEDPFAWAHDNPNRCDVINNKVRDLLLKANAKRVEHYTIPLYRHPPAAQQVAEEKECLCDFRQKMVGDGCHICNPKQAAQQDQWHEAVLHECMMIEGGYVESDPVASVRNLIDWHAKNSAQQDSERLAFVLERGLPYKIGRESIGDFSYGYAGQDALAYKTPLEAIDAAIQAGKEVK